MPISIGDVDRTDRSERSVVTPGSMSETPGGGFFCPTPHSGRGWFRDSRPGPWDASSGCVDWQRVQWEAAYKDVPFAVENDIRSGGRRIHVHEFPNNESWVNEDLGRLRQQISVDGYVFGDRSDIWAEMLFAACNEPINKKTGVASKGMLYLPMRVPLWAVCQSVESSFNADRMGRIDFSMQFSVEPWEYNEAKRSSRIRSSVLLINDVNRAATSTVNSSMARFDNQFTGTHPAVARQAAGEVIRATGRRLRTAAGEVRLNDVAGAVVEFVASRFIDDWADYADAQRTTANTMNRTAAVLAQRTSNLSYYQQALAGLAIRTSTGQILPAKGQLAEGFAGMLWNALAALRAGSPVGSQNSADLATALIPLSNVKPDIRALSAAQLATASVQAELHLAETIAGLVRRMSLSYSIQAAMEVAPAKQPDASLRRSRLLEQIDEEIEALAGNANAQQAMRNLRQSVVAFVDYYSSEGGAAVQIPDSFRGKPLAVIAASVYGRTAEGRDVDLMRFNGVTHPLFSPDTMVALEEGEILLYSFGL